MARRINDYSIKSYRSGDNPFTDEFCTSLMERYQLKTPDDEEFQNLNICLERIFRFYEADKHLTSRKPSKTDTSEIYLYINDLSQKLNQTLDKLSLGHRLELCRTSKSFSLTDLDNIEIYLAQLKTISFIANEELKDTPRVTKNTTLYPFCRGIGEVYDKFTQHRNPRKGITKEKFCIACSDQANVEFRIKDDDDDEQRMKKLLNPSN